MNIVLVRPIDEDDIVEVFVVGHETKDNPNMKSFERQWDIVLTEAKKADPENWNVNEVISRMENNGWQMIRVFHTTTVTY